jgi:hypothetical protein
MHREVAVRAGILAEYGEKRMIDHRNGDVFDNRRENLRVADYALSNANRRAYTVSGLQGVYQQKARGGRFCNKWMFEARWRGNRIRAWGFESPEEAAAARAAAIALRWPERAVACVRPPVRVA